MDLTLRILTLNCWGLPQPAPLGSKDREKRMQEIAKELNTGRYDLVALQEIWSESDFHEIHAVSKDALPYAHYFHSGFTGSGVCVFSRSPIKDTYMHRYSLNGFAHHIHRGDWFGGKVIGMISTVVQGIKINFYSTHIHAEYNRSNDLYLPHRVIQAFEMSQLVKLSSDSADISIVTGDLNLEPEDLGYQLVMKNAELEDAWVARANKDEKDLGATCDVPSNCYVTQETLKHWPNGKRIDYILYHHSKRVTVSTETCEVTMGKIPGEGELNYSDHQGLYAQLKITSSDQDDRNEYRREKKETAEALGPLLERSMALIEEGEDRVKSDRRFFMVSVAALVIVLLFTLNLELSYPSLTIMALGLRFLVVLCLGFSVWYGFVGLTMEEKALKAAKAGMNVLLRNTGDE